MRTTLTIDDDTAARIRAKAQREHRPFKDVVNEALRVGLGQPPTRRRFRVQPHSSEFVPGVDLKRLNQLYDESEADGFVAETPRAHP